MLQQSEKDKLLDCVFCRAYDVERAVQKGQDVGSSSAVMHSLRAAKNAAREYGITFSEINAAVLIGVEFAQS